MDLSFEKNACAYLRRVIRQTQVQEQTQEVRLPDSMPDIGRVLASWGQCVLRSKQWQSDGMSISGGIMTWTLYLPEDGGEPACLEAWLPFQMNWSFPETRREGRIRADCLLRSVDARSLSARRLLVRGSVAVDAEALESEQAEIPVPKDVPPDVELLRQSYPMLLPREAGEKTFTLEETPDWPGGCPAPRRVLLYPAVPELAEEKIVGQRLAFRGTLRLHLLCSGEDGRLYPCDLAVPFSQFAELDGDYGPEAAAALTLGVTGLEVHWSEEDGLHLKCGMVAQYTVSDRVMVELVEDLYSPVRPAEPTMEMLSLPAILDSRTETVHGTQSFSGAAGTAADVTVWPDVPQLLGSGDTQSVELPGTVQVLYYDPEGTLQAESGRFLLHQSYPSDVNVTVNPTAVLTGTPAAGSANGELTAEFDLTVTMSARTDPGLPTVVSAALGEAGEPDPARPSLILRRAEEERLWDLAKRCGSTVRAITEANKLTGEPEADRMLLIPVS